MNLVMLSNYCQHPVHDNQCRERAGHRRPSLTPPVRHVNTSFESLHNSCKYLNQTRCQQETHFSTNRIHLYLVRCRKHGRSTLFLILSVPISNSLLKHFIKYDICGRASDMINITYRQVSNIRRTKSQLLINSRTALWLSLPNPLKPGVKSRTKM